MASQLGLPLVPDTSYYYPRFYLGLPEGEKRELGEIISCDLCFDGRYYAVSGKCLVDREDFICYDVVTRTSLSLGDRVTYEGRELLVSRKKTELAGGEVIFTYRLAGNSYTWVPWEDNPDYTGMSFVGSIVGTQGEQVEVAFDIDKTAAGGNRYGFAPATGNLMYCMPQKGTKTALYIGNGDEAQGIATGCIRTNGSTCEGTGSPEKKSFRSEHGKGMDLYPQRMGLDGGETGKITFEDETGTTIESNGGLVLMAKEGIRLESMTRIAMQGMSDIMALYSEGASSFCVNGSVDMLGRRTSLAGTVYQGYDPFEDVPQKGEFDWGGFARNLVMGLAVGAACIALAVFLPGIGTVAAGALFGAGMGAISASVAGAVSDYSSGNVRSLGEATKDMVISMITGAIGAAFPAVKWFGEGLIDVGSGILTRGMYALLNPDMSTEEKLAYVFDLKQMGVDFITGVAMHFASKGVTAIKSKLTWNKSGTTTLQTGGRQIDYNAYIKRLETIDMEYENIRIDTTDISKIAQNTGMPEWKISRIKDHVFSNEHILDAGVKRFDADPEIADAWYRLTNGTYNQNDIDLLNHEYFESKFESFYKTDYRTAHNKTEESGRIWDPYKENN